MPGPAVLATVPIHVASAARRLSTPRGRPAAKQRGEFFASTGNRLTRCNLRLQGRASEQFGAALALPHPRPIVAWARRPTAPIGESAPFENSDFPSN